MIAFAMDGACPPARTDAAKELPRDVLVRCVAGDVDAFRDFVARYERPVYALLGRMLGGGADVEDLAQEVFLRAFRALPAFDVDGGARPSTWLLTIATRLALDVRKRRRPPLAAMDRAARDVAADAADPEATSFRAELGRAIARAADELPDEQRAAWILAEFHDLTTQEIARILDVPEATAKTRVFRAREKMRARLAHLRGDGT